MTHAPLADLHRHLDGSLRAATLRDLANQLGVTIPDDIRFFRGMGLDAALERFRHTLAVLQQPDAVQRVADEICGDAQAEGVTTLEIRFAPQLHHGASLESVVDAALEGVAGRAGLILCGLYGEPPAVLEHLVAVAESRRGVVGIDLAGGPAPGQQYGMVDYAAAFERARRIGVGRTVHAGEGRPPAEIRMAVELLHAQRIGHGTTVLQDPAVVELVLKRGVTLEACPTSNVHTGVIPGVEDHPLATWLRRGLRACVCTDNTLLSDVDSPTEHRNALRAQGMDEQLLGMAIAYGHAAAFRRE
ncbi:MAG: adenosine deaminase family protein [Myxococcota bacterium]